MKYAEVILLLANNLVSYFDEVYHSAEIVAADDIKFPAAAKENEWISLSPSDTKETIYIRRNGDDEAVEDLKLGGCIKSYKMRSQLRVVYFKDNADCHSDILRNLMQSVLVTKTKLNRIIRDKYKLLKDESSGEYKLGPKAAYFAIDIYILWELMVDECEQDCIELENPLKKCITETIESS